ncbi:hypothetical protein NHH73_26365 [Oxalobacteraceae bacterium OTU3CINTB1]|nr:hypothetical protein NHH73_26365 [Oxalobacteraceae bacterium OTU3CINTB1]
MKRNMTHLLLHALVAIAANTIAGSVFAQGTGMHADLLKRALAESSKGKCSPDIMSPMLRGACEQQMPGMSQMLTNKGTVLSVEFMGTQTSGMGPAEVYKVKFSAGTMMWMINTGPDGKILVFWGN